MVKRRGSSAVSGQGAFRIVEALCIGVALVVIFLVWGPGWLGSVSAWEPEERLVQEGGETPAFPGREANGVIGVASNALDCLAAGGDLPAPASGTVRLTWRGRPERARLVVDVAGSEAPHSIKVNGRVAASVPVRPDGAPCSDEGSFYLDISPDFLIQGDNLIEITADALDGDAWTAANVRLEVFGDFTIPQIDQPAVAGQIGVTGVPSTTLIITFTSSYDGSTQEALVQIPTDYDERTGPVPLLVAIHARNGNMEKGLAWFDEQADIRGWLLASPQLHGSWPVPPDPPGKYAYASLESQYDAVDTVRYVVEHSDYFDVKTDQIYIAGYSMGGQGGVVTAAKFPHLFAAAFDNKGPTDMVEWYDEQVDYYETENQEQVVAMREECHIDGNPKRPAQNPFCYQRRSGIRFANNYLHLPISMTHSISDVLVPVDHSRELRDAINSYGPDWPAVLYEDTVVGPTCPEQGHHCFEPAPDAVLDYLELFTLNNNPTHVNITTDESKSFYWMNLLQTGGDHWSQVEVAYDPVSATVTASVSDTQPVALGFNLGATPTLDIIEQPGMGLPATVYLVKGGGNNTLQAYTSGYLTVTVSPSSPGTLTISAVTAQAWADPPVVEAATPATTTVIALLGDGLNNPVPDGTSVGFSTSAGAFPGGGQTYTAAITGGQATAVLALGPGIGMAEVTAGLSSVTGFATVYVRDIALRVSPSQAKVEMGDVVTYTYRITNTGGITLTGVTLVDDNGTPANAADDITVCQVSTLPGGGHTNCSRGVAVTQTTTNTATVTGRDPLGNEVVDRDSVTVEVEPAVIYLPLAIKNG